MLFLAFSLIAFPLAASAQTVLGVYIFSRHGDRTAKAPGSTHLTNLGYQEVFASGTYYRNRYVASGASSQIANISSDVVKLSQLSVSAPLDNVLMPSATGFLQGLYPPLGDSTGSQELHNGTNVTAPLNGYQIIPIAQAVTGTGSEDQAWLQGSSNCQNAILSSNDYFNSDEYMALYSSTKDFYAGLSPMVNKTFTNEQLTYKNAYTIFDLLNVADIDNATFSSQDLLTSDTLFQLRTLADNHEFNLAYNESDSIRAIAGATLAAQVVQGLNTTITSKGSTKMTIQFGAYGSFQSFFGLANLTQANPDFYGIPDYASLMIFELYTDDNVTSFPSADDMKVRFLFHNGTTNSTSEPVAYPLFGGSAQNLSWSDFTSGMGKFSVGDQADWCSACGNTTGVCSSSSLSSSGSSGSGSDTSSSSGDSGNGLSPAVNGVIGAMVTLAVILGLELLALLLGGFRIVSKKRLSSATAPTKA